MRLHRFVILAFAALLLMQAHVLAQAPVQGRGYEAFQGMRTRNIFDPERRGPRLESAPTTAASRQLDYVALTGTMVTSGKTLAFFAGSRSEFNKVLSVREKIADYTVATITPTHVELEKEGKPVTLPVGKQLSMDGSGAVTASTGASSSTSSSSSGSGSSAETTPPAGVPADKAEILRRMMERRQQEVSK